MPLTTFLFLGLMCMASYVVIATAKRGYASCMYISEGLFTHHVIGPGIVVMDSAINPLINTWPVSGNQINVKFLYSCWKN